MSIIRNYQWICKGPLKEAGRKMKAALQKYDREVGTAFFCPNCKRYICVSGKCKCGTEIDLSLPKIKYTGIVVFD
jgi:hypothetical protein